MSTVNLKLGQLPDYIAGLIRGSELIDFTPAFEDIMVVVVMPATRRNFDESHDPQGNPWPPLKKSRDVVLPLTGRVVKGRPLVKTGNLMQHATDHVIITPRSLEYDTSVWYGIFHRLGTKNMPRREFLGWNDEMLVQAGEILAKHYVGSILDSAASVASSAVVSVGAGQSSWLGRAWGWVKSLFR